MSCPTGKAQYATSTAAARVMQKMDKRHAGQKAAQWHRGGSMVYRCACCHGWHIGHSTQPVKNRKPRYEPVCDWSVA
ncbi:hypothetical protein [Silanimonas sp.]|jgi:hypothetical protein|uniref:hypothetical protein n=1 Tax=Silanimonas sp. TaxID=1929290 RepID=UPI0022BE432C|nr:hypothetical protein [Silanimonas sp.]MCZ8113842.1 hypothetical protein [Silanimonas sp.]